MNSKLHGLELSLTIGCRLNCNYCPQKLLLSRYYGQNINRKSKLDFDDFKIVLDKVQEGGTLSFCGMSEPFHNDQCADMIVYASEKGYRICLNTTLVGMNLSDFEKIKDVSFENFILHIPDQDEHSKFVLTKEYLQLLKLVNEKIRVDYYSCHGIVHEAVKDIIDKEKYAGIELHDRAGNLDLDNYSSISVKDEIICYSGSEEQVGGWMPVMLPDGNLVLCCQDYGMKHILGNLIQQSWNEICNGEEYLSFQAGLKDDSIDILCRKCSKAKPKKTLPAMQLKKIRENMNMGGEETVNISEKARKVIERFCAADYICVFGLGKLWRDHYYQEYWNEGLGTNLFSDNNSKLHGMYINGTKCVEPDSLKKYEKLLVVLFVKNSSAIISQLHQMGIKEYVVIDEVFSACNELCKGKFKNMTK